MQTKGISICEFIVEIFIFAIHTALIIQLERMSVGLERAKVYFSSTIVFAFAVGHIVRSVYTSSKESS